MSTPRSTVAELRPRRRRLEYSHRGRQTTLEFDERHLYERWSALLDEGERVHLLHRLSPRSRVARFVDRAALTRIRNGLALLAGSVVILFSEFHERLPLLAPALALFAVPTLVLAVRDALPVWCAQICDEYNEIEVEIPVERGEAEEDAERRAQFLRALDDAIEAAQQQEYYGEG